MMWSELMTRLAPAYGEDWWFDTVYSFAACETGRLDLAWTLIERSLAKNPRHAHAAHFRTHVMYERGEVAEAIEYLEGWMPGLDKRSLVHCLLSWHVAPRLRSRRAGTNVPGRPIARVCTQEAPGVRRSTS